MHGMEVNPQEMRFKAWHRNMKKMLFVTRLDCDPYQGPTTMALMDPDDPFTEIIVASIDEVDLLPYVGARDADGKDVYLGDIIEDGKVVDNLCVKYGSLQAGIDADSSSG